MGGMLSSAITENAFDHKNSTTGSVIDGGIRWE